MASKTSTVASQLNYPRLKAAKNVPRTPMERDSATGIPYPTASGFLHDPTSPDLGTAYVPRYLSR